MVVLILMVSLGLPSMGRWSRLWSCACSAHAAMDRRCDCWRFGQRMIAAVTQEMEDLGKPVVAATENRKEDIGTTKLGERLLFDARFIRYRCSDGW